jgi:hypothetical protein
MPATKSPEEGSGTPVKQSLAQIRWPGNYRRRDAGERPLFARRPGTSEEVEAAAEELLAPNANADEILGSSII